MNSMPENHNNDSRINDSTDFGKGYAEGYVDAIVAKSAIRAETVAAVARAAAGRTDWTEEQRTAILAAIDAGAESSAEQLINKAVVRWNEEQVSWERGLSRPAGCPDWCVLDHAQDDERDDLVLHLGNDNIDGVTRRLLGESLSIRVARTDCPPEGRTGAPALTVRADLEITTWEQAAELARTILDGFGYLKGAEG